MLRDIEDTVEEYDNEGVLETITTRAGVAQSISYDGTKRLSSVSDPFGNRLDLIYDTYGRIANINHVRDSVTPGSVEIQFGYDSQGRLTTATYPDGAFRTFLYENAQYPQALTGIKDESQAQVSTWHYDASGRAIAAERAGGADSVLVNYLSSNSIAVTDALGAVRTFNYDLIGDQRLPVSISGPRCATCSDEAATTYDKAGFISSRTDYNSNVNCYEHDPARGLETARVEGFAPGSICPPDLQAYTPASGTVQRKIMTSWDPNFRVPTQIVEALRTAAFTYDSSGNVLTKTVTDNATSESRTWTYTYNSYGQVLTEDGPRTDVADVTTYAYYMCASGNECGQLHTVTNALGQTTTFNTYNAHGQPLTITDPNGVVTTLAYDTRHHLSSQQAAGESTSFTYWPTGLVKKVTLPDSSYMLQTYDDAHRLIRVEDNAGDRVEYTLDATGNRTAENVYDPSNTLRRTHTRVFNSLGQLWKEISAAGTPTVTTVFEYDENGNQQHVAAPLGRNTANQYDELNRIKQITDPADGVTQFEYDANDNVTSVIDPLDLQTSYVYNGFGELISRLSPDTGLSHFTYDVAGNLASQVDARGVSQGQAIYNYDALNRPIGITFNDHAVTFTFDTCTNGIGRVCELTDSSGSSSWQYDVQGRVTQRSITSAVAGDVLTRTVTYGYANGHLTSMTMPSGALVSYSYDVAGRVDAVSVTLEGQTSTLLHDVLYDSFGDPLGWTWGNGTFAVRDYDLDGHTSMIDSADPYSYTYDNAGRLTAKQALDGDTPTWTAWMYGYDNLDRLISAATIGLLSQGDAYSEGYTYDANGNRRSPSGYFTRSSYAYSSPMTSNRVLELSGPYSTTFSYTYDAAGNITSDGWNTRSYDAAGRATQVNGRGYAYNGLGQLVAADTWLGYERHFAYDEAGRYLEVCNVRTAGQCSPEDLQEYIWMGDIPVGTILARNLYDSDGYFVSSTRELLYVHTDHLQTPRALTRAVDATGQVVWRPPSEPFGTSLGQATAGYAGIGGDGVYYYYDLRFPGQIFDPIGRANYNYARDYDPATGRYIESDPIGLGSGVNTYAYGEDDPVMVPDRFGLDTAQCTRRLNNVPFRIGPLFHQYVCVGNAKTGYTCRGLGPSGNMFNSPGKLETDSYSPKACQTVQPDNQCVESCIKKTFNNPLPNYSVDLSHGDNCQTYANSTVAECVAQCHAKRK